MVTQWQTCPKFKLKIVSFLRSQASRFLLPRKHLITAQWTEGICSSWMQAPKKNSNLDAVHYWPFRFLGWLWNFLNGHFALCSVVKYPQPAILARRFLFITLTISLCWSRGSYEISHDTLLYTVCYYPGLKRNGTNNHKHATCSGWNNDDG